VLSSIGLARICLATSIEGRWCRRSAVMIEQLVHPSFNIIIFTIYIDSNSLLYWCAVKQLIIRYCIHSMYRVIKCPTMLHYNLNLGCFAHCHTHQVDIRWLFYTVTSLIYRGCCMILSLRNSYLHSPRWYTLVVSCTFTLTALKYLGFFALSPRWYTVVALLRAWKIGKCSVTSEEKKCQTIITRSICCYLLQFNQQPTNMITCLYQ